jgi:hypothetical protein
VENFVFSITSATCFKVHLRSSTLKGGSTSPPFQFSLTQTKKTGVFYVVFEKIMPFSKFLVLQAKMRIDQNARLQVFVQKT